LIPHFPKSFNRKARKARKESLFWKAQNNSTDAMLENLDIEID
jgi:hypothetical protein